MRGSTGAKPGPGRKPGFRLSAKLTKTPVPPKRMHLDYDVMPDVLRGLLDRLKREGQLEARFNEELSMDWRSERSSLPMLLDTLPKQPSFVPRVGELVLFVRSLGRQADICSEHETGEYKIFDTTTQTFGDHPHWEAGIVAQAASVSLEDILSESNRSRNLSLAGFRIEPLSRLGSEDKTISKKYKYVPLHWLRPFVFWSELLRGIPQSQFHPTILNALTVTGAFSLTEKYKFSGVWPNAKVSCKGVYIGSELWVIGDAVRILPDASGVVSDVLHITAVVLQLSNLDKATDDDVNDSHPYSSAVWLYGKIYTIEPTRSWNDLRQPLTKQEQHVLPGGLQGYNVFHRYHPQKTVRVPLAKAFGRCFEPDSMQLWLPNAENGKGPSLSQGASGCKRARGYAKKHDSRILPEKTLYWANNRGEALDIAELNGVLLSRYDPERDEEQLDEWASAAKTLSGAAGKLDKYRLVQKAQQGNKDKTPQRSEAHAAGRDESPDSDAMGGYATPMDQNWGLGLRPPSATPSEELSDEEEKRAISAQFSLGQTKAPSIALVRDWDAGLGADHDEVSPRAGLGRGAPKRSASVAGVDDEENPCNSDTSQEGDKWDDEEHRSIKGVAHSFVARPLARMSGVANAFGLGRGADVKRVRKNSH